MSGLVLPPVLRRVAANVRATPEATAVLSRDEQLTYRELWQRSQAVADRLVDLGAGSGTPVGLHFDRSADLVAAIVGVMRAGSVCVPLDVSYPVDRLRYMCADAGVELTVGHADRLDRLGANRRSAADGSLVFARLPGAARPPQTMSGDLAYLVYTSGSTGRPKGVQFEHRNLANLIDWQIAESGCGPADRTLQFSPASFDVVFQEVFTTLGEGGALVCCSAEERLDPQSLWDVIARERVNRLFVPFVMLQALALFVADASPETHPLREIYSTGEQMQCHGRLRRMFERLPDCRLANQWGTTETHVATCHWLPADVSTWPALPSIGTPIDNCQVRVCDDTGIPVPDGEVGELWIAGECVGPGFLNLPDRTAASYVSDPLTPQLRAYRTGDLGRVGPGGDLELLGRRDTQVKIRGFRVELGEIETLINSMPEVAEAVVTVDSDPAGNQRLCAVLVANTVPLDHTAVLTVLRTKLPEHMVPSRIDVVPSLPRTASGKLDRQALKS